MLVGDKDEAGEVQLEQPQQVASDAERDWSYLNPSLAWNWTGLCEPGAANDAWINGGYTGVVAQAGEYPNTEYANNLYLGDTDAPTTGDNPIGSLLQTGGGLTLSASLSLGDNAGNTGTYDMQGGALNVGTDALVGNAGTGTLTLNATTGGSFGAPVDISSKVAEAADYVVVYDLTIPNTANFRNTTPVPYSLDRSSLINSPSSGIGTGRDCRSSTRLSSSLSGLPTISSSRKRWPFFSLTGTER